MKFFSTLLIYLSLLTLSQAKIKVATLSPLIADLTRQIGGNHVNVIDLIGVYGNPHTFNPTTKTLQKASGASLYIASGKNLEPYLPKLTSLIGSSATVIELGKNIRPHWWQSIENWRKAATTLEATLSKIDPQNKAYYKQKTKVYRAKLSNLHSWSKTQIASIPKSNRILATSQWL